ncbi:MAG: LTA synthase family protein [Clostridium sp.]|nr:LTA synthase family protein [Prevotella sp.]MCM1429568.1 LTA synthase family protein [Clostridium sp.]MCM1476025.1 LTA synthase family protein [Muribaculaceae bacterium]
MNKKISNISRRLWTTLKSQPTDAFLLLLVAIIASSVQLAFAAHIVIPGYIYVLWLCLFLAECMLIYLPFVFIPPRFRSLILIPSILISIWSISTIPYAQTFGHIIPISAFISTSSYNHFVFSEGIGLLGFPGWCAMLLSLAVPIALIMGRGHLRAPFSLGFKKGFTLLTIFALCCAFLVRVRVYSCGIFTARDWYAYFHPRNFSSRNHWFTHSGLLVSVITDILKFPVFERDLSATEEAQLQKVVKEIRTERINCAKKHPSPMDSGVKNVIIILVESGVNTFLQDDWKGPQPMPFLKELSSAPEAATFRNTIVQAAAGRSSDGQMIYMSGFIPLIDIAWANICENTTIPSLLRAGKYSSCEVLGESPSIWNHSATTTALGFMNMKGNIIKEHGEVPVELQDSIIFSRLLAEVKAHRKSSPYFLSAATLNMHSPYTGEIPPKGDDIVFKNLPAADYNYILKSRYFDRALRQFIEGLKEIDAYDDTLIVIASDHDPFEGMLTVADSRRVFMMLLNSGCSGVIDREVAQMDLYPTLLRLTGNADYSWPGFGTDLFYPAADAYNGSKRVIPDSLMHLSWRVLRSRYPFIQ